MKRIAVAAALCAAPAVFAQTVADYVFNVPVNISALGPGHRAEVRCRTLAADSGKVPRTVSQQAATVPLDASGNFSGNVSVRVPYGTASLTPATYECSLVIDGGTTTPPSKSATWTSRGSL